MSRTDALDRLLAISQLLQSDLQRWQAEHGLSTARVHLLWVVATSGPSTQRELATVLEVSPRNVTGLVDALVASGHVVRAPHPHDRRAFLVTLTAEGKAFTEELQRSHVELGDQLFGHLSRSRVEELVELLDDVLAHLAPLAKEAGR